MLQGHTIMTTAPPPPPPSTQPVLSPQASRIFLIGGGIFLAVMGADVALELTGHGGSAIASILTKGLAAVVGAVTTFLAARAPGPAQASLERRLADSEHPKLH